MRVPWFRFSLVLMTAVLGLRAPHIALAQDVSGQTESFSLQLAAGRTLPDYFPLGFVRGDQALMAATGFSQVQDAVLARDFADGSAYPAPSTYQQDPWGLRYFSLALAADSLAGAGAREQLDLFAPATSRYLQHYGQAHVASRVNSPIGERVHLWGLDNEWEAPPVDSPAARASFRAWLQQTYADDIAGLNEAWGTDFADLDASVVVAPPAPGDYRARPGAFLDWYAFSTEHFLQLLLGQARTMHAADPRQRGVVHKATQLTLDRPVTSRERLFDHGRFADLMRPYSGGLYGIDMYGNGDRQAYETSYLFNSIRPEDRAPGYGVLLAETNNHSGPGHQFASTFWRLLANGAKGMMFFTQGHTGAEEGSDWDLYGMRDRATGRFTERGYYAARLAAAIHRSERFWSQAVPAPDLPRIALLQPRRDVLLAESSGRNRAEGRFAYARNERWRVYRWLRALGYWVDVLPYEKLTDTYLRDYAGLLLVGAEHLSAEESGAVLRYVAEGGVLIGDTMPGYFDEHHRVRNPLAQPAGVAVTRVARVQQLQLDSDGQRLTGVTSHGVTAQGAEVLARDMAGQPRALLHPYRRGRILSLPFELGSLVADADQDGDAPIGTWLGKLLERAALLPAYTATYPDAALAQRVRVEQPYVDAAGNVAVVIATRAHEEQEVLPAGSVELPLPGGPWHGAYWAAAETNALEPVAVMALEGARHRIVLPALATAGILYFFREHPPLLGFGTDAAIALAEGGLTARVQAGVAFTLPVQVANAAAAPLTAGVLRVQVPADWTVVPARAPTPALEPGALHTLEFTVMPPSTSAALAPDRPYPLVARWNDGTADRAVMTTLVEAVPAAASGALLLSGNAAYSTQYPHRRKISASYRHLAPDATLIEDPGNALLNGFGSVGGERDSFNRSNPVRAHYVRYAAKEAELLFDLNALREITRVHVIKGPERVTPARVELYTSVDGMEYLPRVVEISRAPRLESVFTLTPGAARYVKIRVEWPQAGGTLDEVEIWGR